MLVLGMTYNESLVAQIVPDTSQFKPGYLMMQLLIGYHPLEESIMY